VVAKGVKVIGADGLHKALVQMLALVGNKSIVTKQLDTDMRRFAHVITGFMESTIFHDRNIAGADAFYAGYEADRGGSHDYAQRAINAFPVEKYFNKLVKPF
jgi:hypothetical protein